MIARYTIKSMQKIARSKEGKCLSVEYKGQRHKLIWMCKFGHTWEANPNSLIHLNSWCPDCAGNKKLDLEAIKRMAKAKGGLSLEEAYLNSKHKMLWECKYGHQWYASTFSIRNRSSWCPECSKISSYKT
jgi:hypothetical protein